MSGSSAISSYPAAATSQLFPYAEPAPVLPVSAPAQAPALQPDPAVLNTETPPANEWPLFGSYHSSPAPAEPLGQQKTEAVPIAEPEQAAPKANTFADVSREVRETPSADQWPLFGSPDLFETLNSPPATLPDAELDRSALIDKHRTELDRMQKAVNNRRPEEGAFEEERKAAWTKANRLVQDYQTDLAGYESSGNLFPEDGLKLRRERAGEALTAAQEWDNKAKAQEEKNFDDMRDLGIKIGVGVAAVVATSLLLPVAAGVGAAVATGAAAVLGTSALAGVASASLGALATGAVAIGGGTAAGTGFSAMANGAIELDAQAKNKGDTFDWLGRVKDDAGLAFNMSALRAGFGGAGVPNSLRAFATTSFNVIKTMGAVYGGSYAAGLMGDAARQHIFQEKRTAAPLTSDNVADEAIKLTQNPNYLKENYTGSVMQGIELGDKFLGANPYTIDTDLHWLKRQEGDLYAFRYIPDDMHKALLAAKDKLDPNRFMVKDNKVYIAEMASKPKPDLSGVTDEKVEIWTELLPPFRSDMTRNNYLGIQWAQGSKPGSFSFRYQGAFGQLIEGLRPNFSGELTFNYPYSFGPVSTLRLGLPPGETSGIAASGQLGIRQQHTEYPNRIKFVLNPLSVNPGQALNGSNPDDPMSNTTLSLLGLSAYADNIKRVRQRLDMTLNPASWRLGNLIDPRKWNVNDLFARMRYTYGLEVGLGTDFARVQKGNTFYSANGYLEAQAYTPNAMVQANLNPTTGSINIGKSGLKNIIPEIEIDPALQLSTNALPVASIPGIGNFEDAQLITDRTWKADAPRMGDIPFVIRPPIRALEGSERPLESTLVREGEWTSLTLADGLTAEVVTYRDKRYMLVDKDGSSHVFEVTGIPEELLRTKRFSEETGGLPPVLLDRP